MFRTVRFTLLATLALAASAMAQFVPAPTDLTEKMGAAGISVRYKQVPNGICETRSKVKSYSGYADVGVDQHIYFQFFEARHGDATKAPLTIWFNGGPGSSSMIGLFQELGPCGIDANGKVFDNPYAWNEASNMIFLDQPVTTGFSYSKPVSAYVNTRSENIVNLPSNDCPDFAAQFETCGTYSAANVSLTANTTAGAAPNVYKALQGFLGAFPEYNNAGVNIATESYGGHYAPATAAFIIEQNKLAASGHVRVDLRSVAIGNGWYDPRIQYRAYRDFVRGGNSYGLAYPNASVMAEVDNALEGKGNCLDQIEDCYRTQNDLICSTADSFCANEVENAFDVYLERDEYDARYLTPDPFPYNYYVKYLNQPDVQAALGVFTNYTDSSPTTSAAFASTGDDARESQTIENIHTILDAGITVAIYVGDADYNCGITGQVEVVDKIAAAGYSQAGFTNLTTSDGIVHGQVKQSGIFSFTRFYLSGHEVPFYKPLASLEMFERVINGKDIATGKHSIKAGSKFKTVGPPTSDYFHGNATVQYEVTPANSTYNTTTGMPNPSQANTTALAEMQQSDSQRRQLRFLRRTLEATRRKRQRRS